MGTHIIPPRITFVSIGAVTLVVAPRIRPHFGKWMVDVSRDMSDIVRKYDLFSTLPLKYMSLILVISEQPSYLIRIGRPRKRTGANELRVGELPVNYSIRHEVFVKATHDQRLVLIRIAALNSLIAVLKKYKRDTSVLDAIRSQYPPDDIVFSISTNVPP